MAKISELKQRISIQKRDLTKDGQGGFSQSWVQIHSVWAKIEPKSANEAWRTDSLRSERTHVIEIRWLEEIDSEMRIEFEGRLFQILGVRRSKEERWFMLIDAKEGIAA